MPAVRCRSRGDAAAHRPNAPSTCTQAPASCAASIAGPKSSNAPEWMFPACRRTIAGPLPAASVSRRASTRMRPCSSLGTAIGVPSPRYRPARSTVPCRSSPTMNRIAGPPAMPAVSTSQPARRSTASRAAAMHVNCAMVAPVANPTWLPSGSPSRSTSHSSASSSTATAPGEMVRRAVFWSHVDTSQSAASATGCVPPMTQP